MAKFKDKMQQDLRVRGYSRKTEKAYIHCMRNFIKFHMIPPDKITEEDI